MSALYILFVLSVFCPIYTYAMYPIILKIMRTRKFKQQDMSFSVTAIVIGDTNSIKKKVANLKACHYSDIDIIVSSGDIMESVRRARGDILLFTDTETDFDVYAIQEIVKPFADERVACVVGQQTSHEENSAFWKYENTVKCLESKIGCVSGANETIFAVRKSDMPVIDKSVINKPFFITTSITQSGKNVIFQPSAKAYETKTEGSNFNKHVQDAAGYWQAFRLFSNMLLPRKGCFVYVSHRVMKWFVWLNMLTMLVTSCVLAFKTMLMMAIFCIQVIGYVAAMTLGSKERNSIIGKLLNVGHYFIMLNLSYFLGLSSKGGKI